MSLARSQLIVFLEEMGCSLYNEDYISPNQHILDGSDLKQIYVNDNGDGYTIIPDDEIISGNNIRQICATLKVTPPIMQENNNGGVAADDINENEDKD